MTTSLLTQFLYAGLATFGFTIIFRVPKSDIFVCSLIGALGWLTYQFAAGYGFTAVMACFLGACTVALLSDIFSKLLKDASTIFIIPGIMPLVPGAGMYRMMLELINNDMSGFATEATQTLLSAGAIAVGLLVMGSLLKMIRMAGKKIRAAF
ncbi:MAG: threonine/serine exporter family protein [Mogibacterium sp.]|nr:threonine/serine exporter family protein [Mogibacterium sp.]